MNNKCYKFAVFFVALMISWQASALVSRVYCFYIPTEKLKLSPLDQIKSAQWLKLMDANKPTESHKVEVAQKPKYYSIDKDGFEKLFKGCEAFIGNKGKILEIKGSNAASFETLSSFYRIVVDYPNGASLIQPLSDEEVLKKLGLSEDGQKVLAEALATNVETLNKLINNELVEKSSWAQGVNKIASISNNPYAKTALTIAGLLALAWFAPPYVASAVDLLYPLVYQALWGVPSTWSLSYWLVYYPGKMHAVAWAYNNASLLISGAGTLLGLVKYAATQVSQTLKQKDRQKLEGSQIQIPQS